MANGGRVEVDTDNLRAGVRRLVAGLERSGKPVASQTASDVAQRLRDRLPKRTGRLAATVRVSVEADGGAAVHYGGTLPYANYIDHRTGAVDQATSGSAAAFHRAMQAAAASEVHRL